MGRVVQPGRRWPAITERVELGPLVAATSFHNPALLAKKAATVDEISGGRLILGLGAGWNETEYRAYGFPFDHRVSRFEEAFTIIRSLLRDGRVDFAGTYHQARDCLLLPRGPRPAGPPLMVGSMRERMLAITLPHVDAWNAWFTWFGNTVEGYRDLRARIDDACRTAGRDPGEVERTVALFVGFEGARGRPARRPVATGYRRHPGRPCHPRCPRCAHSRPKGWRMCSSSWTRSRRRPSGRSPRHCACSTPDAGAGSARRKRADRLLCSPPWMPSRPPSRSDVAGTCAPRR